MSSSTEATKLAQMDTQELKEHFAQMEQELHRREMEDRIHKARDLEKQAQAMGFVSLAEAARTLSGLSSSDRPRTVYVNPEDGSQTWSGRGRKPKWVHEFLRTGGKVEDLVARNIED